MAVAIAAGIIADSGVVDVMKDYIFSRAKEEFKSVWYLKDEINGISELVETIKRVEEDAEKQQLQNEDVRKWVSDRKNAGYDMEDVLDDYRVMVSTEHGQGVVTRWMGLAKDGLYLVCGIPLSCCLEIIPAPVTPRIEIAHRVRSIQKKLEGINQRKTKLSLVQHSGGGSNESETTTSRETSSLEDKERPMIGRNELKTKIKEALLNSSRPSTSKLSIVCIVGVGGMGKTTLAQNIYNDEDVKAAFSFMEWLYVGDRFDCKRLLNKITGNSSQHGDLNVLHSNVAKKVKRESFLIVLDDAWLDNGEEWGRFLRPLSQGDKGGAIIVTTRNSAVGNAIPHQTKYLYELARMSDAECMEIFKSWAFMGQKAETYPDLKHLSEQVVQKLKGVPLAARILGGYLHKHLHNRHKWINVAEVGWPHTDKENVVDGVVGLSYLHLPSHLKRCFAYCAMFPKGFEFDKETMVRMWIAQGYVEKPRGNELMEHIGSDYFNELCQRSFLQFHPRDLSKISWSLEFYRDHYLMHDLIHDFAAKVFTEGFQMDASDTEDSASSEEIRHLSAYCNETETQELKILENFKKLRTLILESHVTIAAPPMDVLAMFKYLRLLVLRVYRLSEFPDSIRQLQFLQYLDISSTRITALPEPVCDLVNLLFLILPYPCALPEGMNKLVNLRFIKVREATVPQFKGIGQLTSLQQLDTFKVVNKSGWMISELGGLNHLHGKLGVRGLQNVTSKEEAEQACLKRKVHLEELVLAWTVLSSVQQEHVVDSQVLEGLFPPPHLKVLEIRKNRGARFPSWMEEHRCPISSSLVRLELDGCCNWECLPTLGRFPSLKKLVIRGASSVKKIGPEFYGGTDEGGGVYFPRLEYLCLAGMSAWEEWEMPAGEMEGGGRRHLFPSLEKLCIKECPKLPSLSPVLRHLTSLVSIEISRCDELAFLLEEEGDGECGWMLPSLEELRIQECPMLASLSPILRRSSNLKRIDIKKCAELASLSEEEGDGECGWMFPSLKRLSIQECPKLASLSPILRHPANLKRIYIKKCDELASLKEREDDECGWMFPSLEELNIEECPKLASLSSILRHSANLERIYINKCDELASLKEEGDDGCGWMLPSLELLSIVWCPKLSSLSPILRRSSNLERIEINRCAELASLEEEGDDECEWTLPSLEKLSIKECPKLASLSPILRRSSNLKIIEIKNCAELALLSSEEGDGDCGWMFPCCLEKLIIHDCSSKLLPSLSQMLPHLTALERLHIGGFRNLQCLPPSLHNLRSLRVLYLVDCPAIECLPDGGLPPSLRELWIEGCPLLEGRCREGGPDRPNIPTTAQIYL